MKKNKKETTYEQLSLFGLDIETYAEGNEPEKLPKIITGQQIESSDSITANRNQESLRSGAGTISEHILQYSERELHSTNSTEPETTGMGVRTNQELDILDTLVYQDDQLIYLNSEFDKRKNLNQKYQDNIEAINLLYQLDQDNRSATTEEKYILAGYTGWGGLPQVFNNSDVVWKDQYSYLKSILTYNQYEQARGSTLTSFYTPIKLIHSIYNALDHIGFEHGRILDPSIGSGNMFGGMPEYIRNHSTLFGTDLDEITSKIAAKIYPDATIMNAAYEKSNFKNDFFDLAITNVPFGRFKVHDLEYNKYNYDIHNYFFIKSIDKIRAGGIICFITAKDTLDGRSDICFELAKRAELVTAIRFPDNLFTKNGANTQIVSDLIILIKKDKMETEIDPDLNWTKKVKLNNDRHINQYFVDNPQNVLGDLTEITNQYGKPDITVKENGRDTYAAFDKIISLLPTNIYHEEHNENSDHIDLPTLPNDKLDIPDNAYFIYEDNLCKRNNYYYETINAPETPRIKDMVNIVETVKRIIAIQMENKDEEIYNQVKNKLNLLYDNFIKEYGYLNSRKNISLFKYDPNYFILSSLEKKNGNKIEKADIFYKRTIRPKIEITEADSIEDALSLSKNKYGKMNFQYMSYLTKLTEKNIIEYLDENNYIYLNPINEQYELAEEYLSGNVRMKLTIASQLAEKDPYYLKNVKALESILPEKIMAEDITVQLGATWIPSRVYKEFISNLFDLKYYEKDNLKISYSKYGGSWVVDHMNNYFSEIISTTWGVQTCDNIPNLYSQPIYNGWSLFNDLMSGKIPTIYNYWEETEDDRTVRRSRINVVRTQQAQMLAEQMNEELQNWIFEDYDRREELEKLYNDIFNSHVARKYDGSYLKLDNLSIDYQLETYQKNTVARQIESPTCLIDQPVGSGKTLEMITAGLEMKRMGIRNKIIYTVPNSLVTQWANEFLKAFPTANILAATPNDFAKSKRQQFLNKMMVNDYDAIIMAHSSFKLIPMPKEYQEECIQIQIDNITHAIEEEMKQDKQKNTRAIKLLERAKKTLETQIKELTDIKRDDGITFDQLGIDQIFVDEAHAFKNLFIYSKMQNISGVPQAKSQKASDMYMKTQYILKNNGGVVFATATPVSNTMAELYNMQRYLQEDRLHDLNIYSFDSWAKNFGKVVTSLEISIDGRNFQTRQRFCKFFNVQELMSIFRECAEIMTPKMLYNELSKSELGRKNAVPPNHIDGKPLVVVAEPTSELDLFMEQIIERTEAIHGGKVSAYEDNMLVVVNDSRKAAIDIRLINEDIPKAAETKVDLAIQNIYQIYLEYNDKKATQLVFSDRGVPKPDRYNIYDYIKNELIKLGVPSNEIEFIHSAKNNAQLFDIQDRMNNGNIRILLGSTEKLGTGTNVQNRVIAVHHIDAPQKASEIIQRNGRGFRQGNMHDKLYEFRYVTKRSFDTYLWQNIETKATYTEQMMSGETTAREYEEKSEELLSYAEVKAIASGNPLIKEKMSLEQDINKLQALKKQFLKVKYANGEKLIKIPREIKKLEAEIAFNIEESKQAKDSFNTADIDQCFSINLLGYTFTNMKEANEKIVECTLTYNKFTGNLFELGEYNHFKFGIKYIHDDGWNLYLISQQKEYRINNVNAVGRVNFERLNRKIDSLKTEYLDLIDQKTTLAENLETCHKIKNQTFKQDEELQMKRKRLKEVEKLLNINQSDEMLLTKTEPETPTDTSLEY